MKIGRLLRTKRTVSFEVFPPRKEDAPDLRGMYATIARLAASRPDFISVTYQTTGRTRDRSLEIADFVHSSGLTAMSHVTAVGYLKEDVDALIEEFHVRGIDNVLALRGDVPPGLDFPNPPWRDFRYASDLVAYIRAKSDVSIGVACYPEGHPECPDAARDLDNLKRKCDAGADFLVTQLFFDDGAFFRFRDRARRARIGLPIVAGIMPVLKARQIRRIVELSRCAIPAALDSLLAQNADNDEGMRVAGVKYAAAQIRRLWLGGVDGIHVYTMNRPAESAEAVRLGLDGGVS